MLCSMSFMRSAIEARASRVSVSVIGVEERAKKIRPEVVTKKSICYVLK
jgi:hypothetical protein